MVIASVDPGGVAEAAELKESDVIIRFNGRDTTAFSKDEMVELIVEAGTSTIEFTVKHIPDDQLEPLRAALLGEAGAVQTLSL